MEYKIKQMINSIKKNSELFKTPVIVEDGKDVIPMMFNKIQQYKEFFNGNELFLYKNEEVKNITDRLKEAIESYLSGDLVGANEKVNLVLTDDRKLYGKLTIETIDKSFIDKRDEIKKLYKARIGTNYSYSHDEMFHIPFNKRGITKNQRYSVNGMPCLYLGTSAYICWEELDRPDLNSLWISRYEVMNKNLKILNLSYTIKEIEDKVTSLTDIYDKTELIISYVLSSIIQILCSIKVKNSDRVFREEYIIPQLIMQNMHKANIDGVMYLSVKTDYDESSTLIKKNLAFPAKDYEILVDINNNLEFDKTLYEKCLYSIKLKKSFNYTDPINLGLENTVEKDDAIYFPMPLNDIPKDWKRELSEINVTDKKYLYTSFYKIEAKLETKTIKPKE